ncbi:MAG: hypothetical protein RLY71_3217, partial [Pseudomonadota bacterium]
NALEQRTAKYGPGSVVPTGFVFYAYDEAGHLLGEYDINGVPFYEVIWLGDLPLAVIKQTRTGSGTTLNVATRVDYIYADHLDTPRVIVRSGDHVPIWRWDNSADPFGAVPPSDNPNGLGVYIFNLRMPGQVFDSESGMFYNMQRDYVAGWGRYAQSDPIGLAGGINTYAYANGNPVSYIDPTGEAGLLGAGVGAGLEFGIQALKNYRNGCDVFDVGNYNWYDVGVSAAVGAIAPGWLAVGKTAGTSGRAIANLTEQLGRAQTANRAAKIEGRIASHSMSIADVLVPQLGFQGVKELGKQVSGAGGANDCTCRK